MTPSTLHYSPYLVDSSAESRAWVVTVGSVFSYGIPAEPEGNEEGPADPEAEAGASQLPPPAWPLVGPPAGAGELMR